MASQHETDASKEPHWGRPSRMKIQTICFAFLLCMIDAPVFVAAGSSSDPRLVAFVGNWQPCPTQLQIDMYSHLVISFAVSYTYDANKNICDEQCAISTPIPICGNVADNDLVQRWRSDGKKVLLSFGGAGMGGSWEGDVNGCWEYCFGREDFVVGQLVDIVNSQGFDGVDIDYEYHFKPAAKKFLKRVTSGLRGALPSGSILTHTPMDSDVWEESLPYYEILKNNIADKIDFLMVQYYNGVARPSQNSDPALDNYAKLAEDVFRGDAGRVVFGFCVAACSDKRSNVGGAAAAGVLTELGAAHPGGHGGAFFWAASDDGLDASWSSAVYPALYGSPPLGSGDPSSTCQAVTVDCGPDNPCSDGTCCSQWGYCGDTGDHCGECCVSNCWPTPTPSEATDLLVSAKYSRTKEQVAVFAESASAGGSLSLAMRCEPPCGEEHQMKYSRKKGIYSVKVAPYPKPASVTVTSSDGSLETRALL